MIGNLPIDQFSIVFKIMAITAFSVYAIFSFVLISQVRAKRQTITTQLGPILELIAYIHAILSILLIVLSLIIL